MLVGHNRDQSMIFFILFLSMMTHCQSFFGVTRFCWYNQADRWEKKKKNSKRYIGTTTILYSLFQSSWQWSLSDYQCLSTNALDRSDPSAIVKGRDFLYRSLSSYFFFFSSSSPTSPVQLSLLGGINFTLEYLAQSFPQLIMISWWFSMRHFIWETHFLSEYSFYKMRTGIKKR